ncbi:HK97 family phage prohead protease [Arthrobacter sp. UM1]|uniref:HK97 family phage prohead protease n=1 Tax=Arthrobacter sp. UM1 TaxID=2766776 RepID=UPI001CF678DB|nr:HK97 family phage prohead protease [Arthrobacter sp. UM1]MCB4209167.1 HK97 family phage prohead protease [Arthrobacter sp. UM1]
MTITLEDLTRGNALAQRALGRLTRSDDGGGFTGLGLVYGETYETPWFRERFEPGCVPDDEDAAALILWRHDEPIGRVTAAAETDAGREITAALSRTTRAAEVRTLLADGVIDKLSVGFEPVQWREEHSDDDEVPLIVHEKIRVREYSLVPFPAYETAAVSSTRSRTSTTSKETPMGHENLITRAEHDDALTALTAKLEDIERRAASAATAEPSEVEAIFTRAAQFSSFGEFVQAIANPKNARHEAAATLYRDITTANIPTADKAGAPGFIGDLTRKVNERRRWTNRFTGAPLPAKGMTLDYVKTKTTATVAEQENQLDELAKGAKFTLEAASSKVRTFGGAETLSRQVIDRMESSTLTSLFEAFALAYARQTEAATKAYAIQQLDKRLTAHQSSPTEQAAIDLDGNSAFDWIDVIVDAAGIFEDRGYDLQALALSPDKFKALAHEAGTDGRPLLTVSGQGVNIVGTLNLPQASGDLLRVPVNVLHGTTGRAMFYDPIAIQVRESAGAPFQLQDDNVLNLSRDFAVYGYLAHLTPHPDALLPVNFKG